MMLKNNSEFIADLKDVTIVDGTATFSFAIDKKVQVPASAFAETDLRSYIGERVGITYVGGVYRIRRVSQSSKKEKHLEGE